MAAWGGMEPIMPKFRKKLIMIKNYFYTHICTKNKKRIYTHIYTYMHLNTLTKKYIYILKINFMWQGKTGWNGTIDDKNLGCKSTCPFVRLQT